MKKTTLSLRPRNGFSFSVQNWLKAGEEAGAKDRTVPSYTVEARRFS
jgi:hypothetical protein